MYSILFAVLIVEYSIVFQFNCDQGQQGASINGRCLFFMVCARFLYRESFSLEMVHYKDDPARQNLVAVDVATVLTLKQ